jgi:hypothetical protein
VLIHSGLVRDDKMMGEHGPLFEAALKSTILAEIDLRTILFNNVSDVVRLARREVCKQAASQPTNDHSA